MNLNKAFVLGNVTRDPEMRSLPSGQQVASFGIATNRFYTDQGGQKKQDVEFHNVVCFGKLADITQRFLTKGSLVLIEGRLKTSNWQDQSGTKKYKTEIIAEALQLGPKGSSSQGGYPSGGQSSFTKASEDKDIPIIEENTPPANFVNIEEPPKGSDEVDVKDIPF